MDETRGFEDDRGGNADDTAVTPAAPPPVVGNGERRMHVRAYNHWVSLLADRPVPPAGSLQPSRLGDLGRHGVLLDFTVDPRNPAIAWLGEALRDECGIEGAIATAGEAPSGSLLAHLIARRAPVLANHTPLGFEAEFVGARGRTMMYRGILLPFGTPDGAVEQVYGVINWKERVEPAVQARLDVEVGAALQTAPAATPPVQAWADGPGAEVVSASGPLERRPALGLVQLPVDAPSGYVLLLGRVAGDSVEIVADVSAPEPLADAIRRAG